MVKIKYFPAENHLVRKRSYYGNLQFHFAVFTHGFHYFIPLGHNLKKGFNQIFGFSKTFILFYFILFFYQGFLSQTLTTHRTAGEGRGYLFNSSRPLPPASHLDINRAITTESSPMHIAGSRTRTVNHYPIDLHT